MGRKFNIPEKIFWRIVICLAVIAIVIIAGIIPLASYESSLNADIKALKNKIEEQKNLSSAYALLMKEKEQKKFRILSNPAKTALPRHEANRFQDVFKEIAEKSGLKTVSVTPELNALTGSANYMVNTAVARGEFPNFRRMLVSLGDISYLDKIEEIRIQQTPDALEFKMKVVIALGN